MNRPALPKPLKPMLNFLLFLALSVAALLTLLYFQQGRLLYQPSAAMAATPKKVGLVFDDVTLLTDDQVKLHGWYVHHPRPSHHLIFFHGNAGNISHRLGTLAAFNSVGAETLIIDYRGFGQSEGEPNETGTYLDASAAWRYMVDEKKIAADNIVIYGRSLGGAVAAELAARVPARAVVVESSFSSLTDLAAEVYPWLPTKQLLRYRYPSVEYLRRTTAPVLIAHSEGDGLIDIRHGQTLFEAAPAPSYFYALRGRHNSAFSASGDAYLQALQRFFDAPHSNPLADGAEFVSD